MIESERNFTQVKVEKFTGYTTVRIEPMFRITPKPPDTVNVRPPLGAPTFLAHHDVVTPDSKRRIGVPVVRIVQTARPGVYPDQTDNLGPAASLNREDPDLAIAPEDAQNNDFPSGTPTPLTRPVPAKHSLIAFHDALKRLSTLFLVGEHGPDETEKALDAWWRCQAPKTGSVAGYTKHKILDQLTLRRSRQATGIRDCRPRIAPATAAAFESPVSKLPGPGISAFCTLPHTQTRLNDLVRFA